MALSGLSSWAFAGLLLALGCGNAEDRAAGELGEACLLGDEGPEFYGYWATQTTVFDEASTCESGLCLGHGFQGLIGCPYGQVAGEGVCLTASGETVEVAVLAQLVARPPSLAVICSCRCFGPGPGPFCECPDGMACAASVPERPGTDNESEGLYCVLDGSSFPQDNAPREDCDRAKANCDDRLND
jgi:hypothetical protein